MGQALGECCAVDCHNKATHHLVGRVWAIGHSKKNSKPLKFVLGLWFCTACGELAAKTGDVCTPAFWKMVDDVAARARKVPVDPETFELKAVKGPPAQHQIGVH